MSIFTRFKDIVNSNINSLLDKAEDPEKMLRLMIGEMEDTVIDLKTTTAARMAEAIRSEKKVDEAKATVDRWQARAELAIEKGKDDLAREALMEKKHAQETYERALENISSLKKSIEEGKEEIFHNLPGLCPVRTRHCHSRNAFPSRNRGVPRGNGRAA